MPAPLLLRRAAKPTVGSAFNPLTQVTALHAVWAEDPSWTNPGNGNPVDSWRNQSGGGDPANTGTNRPTFRSSTAAFNNRATVEFASASSQYLDFNIADQAQSFKLLLVCSAATGAAQRFLGRGAAATAQGLGVTAGNAYSLHYGANLNGSTSDANPHVLRATVNGASSQLWKDGSSILSGSASTGNQQRFLLGAGYDGSAFGNYLNGHIAFAAIYSGATSDTDLATLETALKSHYGIA